MSTRAQQAVPLQMASPQSYTPTHLAERILSSRGAIEGERKQVTVLFADLKGSMELLADRDPEEARRILDPVLERMMEAVHRYEGTVNQVMGDGVMALFGAPVAHEDHAVRACYAALSMQEAVNHYAEEVRRTKGVPVQIRVGLNSGEVVVRSIGSDLRMDYTAVGQTTHLAARMEQLALPGSTLLSPDTLRLAEGYVRVKPLGPMAVQGLEQPIEVYELNGAGTTRSRLQASVARGLTRFVGRDAEMETLRQALDRAGAGHGQLVAVVGEPGVGKSRLVYELVHSHRTHGWLVLEAGSVSYGKATPYLPVTDLLKAYFQVEPQDDERRIREKVAGKVLMLDEALRPYLPACLTLLDVPVEDAAWRDLDPAYRKQQTLDAIKRLLLRESQVQPLLLVFEDLHWIDGETQALLDGLVESIPSARVLLLVNYRPEYGHGWARKTYYAQLRLDPLGPESAEELLRALLGEGPGLEALRRLLIERTEGNPFFLEESVRTLVETGALVGERGAYRLARSVESTQVPSTVQAMLAARIDRLPPEEKRLLQSAAVIGKDVPYGLLQAIAEAPEEQLQQRLVRLQGAEFLYEASLFPELEYTFKHALTHEVAYGSLLQERRRALHADLLEAMERVYMGRLEEHAERLAHHAVRAERWERAVSYLQEASAKAAARSAYEEAVRLLEQAIEAQQTLDPRDTAKRCDLLLALIEALGPAGQARRAFEEVAPEALDLAEALSDTERAGRVCLAAIRAIRRWAGGVATGVPVFREWVERADRYVAPDLPGRVQVDSELYFTQRAMGQWSQGSGPAMAALELARRLGTSEALFSVAGTTAGPWTSPKRWADAVSFARELVAAPREGASTERLVLGLDTAQMVLLAAGDRPAADRVGRDLDFIASEARDPALQAWPLREEGLRAALEGDLEGAIAAGARYMARADELGMAAAGRLFVREFTFWPLLYLGRPQEALERQSLTDRVTGRRGPRTAFRFGRAALCLAQLGRNEEAQRLLVEDLQSLENSPEWEETPIRVLAALLATAVEVGDRDAAALLAARLDGIPSSPAPLENVGRLVGEAALLCGDRAAAQAHLQRALEWATALRHRPQIALTRLKLAELLIDEPKARGPRSKVARSLRAEAGEYLEFAISEFQAMNMQPALEQALRQKSLLTA